MYKVYDNENKKWITDKCMISPDGNLYQIINKKFIKTMHSNLCSNTSKSQKYIVYRSIGLTDKSNELIYEGYILREEKGKIGLVHYSTELAAYVFVHVKENKFYPLGAELCKKTKILGNVIDDSELLYM